MLDSIFNDSAKLIFITVALLSLLELAGAIYFYLSTKNFIANSKRVKVRVVNIEPSQQADKAHFTITNELGQSFPASLQVAKNSCKLNDEIEVYSYNDNPARVRPTAFLPLWAITLGMFQGALVTAGLVVVFVYMDIAHVPF